MRSYLFCSLKVLLNNSVEYVLFNIIHFLKKETKLLGTYLILTKRCYIVEQVCFDAVQITN